MITREQGNDDPRIGYSARSGVPKIHRTFPTGGPVPADDLVGREDVLRDLFARTYEHGNSVLLTGPRQVGKTSVIDELLRRVRRAGDWGVYIDCSRTTGDEEDLARLIARATYDDVSGSVGAFARLREIISGVPKPVLYQSDLDLALTFHGGDSPPAAVLLERSLLLADNLAVQKNKRCVVVYDEFSVLRKVSPTIFTRIRAVLQHSMTNTAYVFMGSETGLLEQLFKDPDQMPFGLAVPITLEAPSPDAWKQYIEQRFSRLHVPLRTGDAGDLITFTGGHPRDLMEACEHLLTIRSLNPDADGAVRLAERKTMSSLLVKFDEMWRRLDEPAGIHATLVRLSAGQPVYGRGRPKTSVSRTIERLEDDGVIRRIGRGTFEFTEPLFARYVREMTT
jgi:hypothetical protein